MYLRQHDAIASKRDMFMVDPRELAIEPGWNVRDLDSAEERPALDELKESLRERGVLVPLEIRLRDDRDLVITAGHRRLKAVMELIAEGEPIKTVPCVPEAQNTSPEERTINMVVSNSGKPLTSMQVAEVVRRLVAFGWEKPQIAKRLGWKSTASVNQHLDMLMMPEAVKQQVRDGEVSATFAAKLVKEQPEFAEELIRADAEEKQRLNGRRRATPKGVKRAAEKAKPKSDPPPRRTPAASLAETVLDHAAGAAAPLPDTPTAAPAYPPADVDPPAQVAAGASVAPAPASSRQSIKHLIDALEPFAVIAHEHDFAERSDDDLIEVPFRHLKQAWIVFAKATGGEQ